MLYKYFEPQLGETEKTARNLNISVNAACMMTLEQLACIAAEQSWECESWEGAIEICLVMPDGRVYGPYNVMAEERVIFTVV